MYHHLYQLEEESPCSSSAVTEDGGSGRCDVSEVGGGAEYVLIGGPVKQLGKHILSGLWLISLEPVVRKHLSIITTSPSLRKRRKRTQLWKGIFLLAARASLQLNPLFEPTMTRSAFLCLHICSLVSLPLHPCSVQSVLSICVSVLCLSGQWSTPQNEKNKVRTNVIKNLT